jgi:nucleoid-associated protein YgaU
VTLKTDGNTNTFTYTYHADGRQREVIGQGSKKAAGTTTFTYDANDRQIRVDKGKGDGMDRAEFLTFVYNNDGQIIFRFHDEGKDSNRHGTEYQYANGNPVGERKDQNGTITEQLDTGDYNLVKNIGDEFPTQAVSSVTVIDGDSLQSIAARVYGNPSLWFVLAEANGLDPSQPLKAGTRITVPNTIETGALNADAHVVYDESSIIGSALPNLKTPKKKGCGNILAIIIVVVIAVVIAIYAAPLLSVLGSAIGGVLGGGAVATFAGTVIAGAIVGAAASIVQQGLMVAMGYQEKFSWSDVGKAALVGAVTAGINTGAASGLKSLGEASSTWAKVAQVAIKVGQNAAVQVVKNGKITSWTSLAATALGSSAQSFGSGGVLGALDEVVNGDTIGKYVTPWLNAAESYVRTGEVTTADWANAVGSTLSASLGNGRTSADLAGEDDGSTSLRQNLADMARFTGTQALVAGAMAFVDRDAAAQYFASTLGQEVGDRLGAGFSTGFAAGQRRAEEAEENRRKSQAETSRLAEQASTVPDEPVLDAPTPSNGEQFLPLTDEELEAQAAAENQDQLDTVQETLTEPPVIESTKLKPGQTLWALAKKDLGPGATDAEILARAQQYMEINGISDPRRLQAGQQLLIPSGSEVVSVETKRAYGQSDRELRAYYAEREAAAAAAAAAAQEGAYIRETVSLMEAAANDPNSFYGTMAIAKLSGMTMDQVLAARAGSANMPSLDVPSGGAVAAAPQEQGMSTYDKVSFGVHSTLAVAGAFPVLGVVPDAVDFLYTVGEWPFGKSTGTDVALAGGGILTTVVPGGDQAMAGVKIATRAGRQVVSHLDEVHDAKVIINQAEAVSDAKKATPLLPGELDVGTYGDLKKAGSTGDNITPHHIPSAAHMETVGVSKADGLSINVEMPVPGTGGRHRRTFTYGTDADVAMSSRDALASGVRDLRRIYQQDGLYSPKVREALQKLIADSKAKYPQHFTVKPPKK